MSSKQTFSLFTNELFEDIAEPAYTLGWAFPSSFDVPTLLVDCILLLTIKLLTDIYSLDMVPRYTRQWTKLAAFYIGISVFLHMADSFFPVNNTKLLNTASLCLIYVSSCILITRLIMDIVHIACTNHGFSFQNNMYFCRGLGLFVIAIFLVLTAYRLEPSIYSVNNNNDVTRIWTRKANVSHILVHV